MPRTNLEKLIEEKEFISPRDLISCGLFRTRSSVKNAVENGTLEELRISERISAITSRSLKHLFFKNYKELDF